MSENQNATSDITKDIAEILASNHKLGFRFNAKQSEVPGSLKIDITFCVGLFDAEVFKIETAFALIKAAVKEVVESHDFNVSFKLILSGVSETDTFMWFSTSVEFNMRAEDFEITSRSNYKHSTCLYGHKHRSELGFDYSRPTFKLDQYNDSLGTRQLPRMSLANASPSLHSFIKRTIKENHCLHPDYKAKDGVNPFIQGGHTDLEGWLLIEFWCEPEVANHYLRYLESKWIGAVEASYTLAGSKSFS